MNKPLTSHNSGSTHLSVIHKAGLKQVSWLFHLHDAVIQTDLHFTVIGWNMAAETMHGQSGAMGKYLFKLVKIEFLNGSLDLLQKELAISGCWGGEVIFHRYDGQQLYLHVTANYVYDENNIAQSIIFVAHNIGEAKAREKKLAQMEEALRKSNERFEYVARITSDAIWDVDLEKNRIYRSRAFNRLSGYSADETEPNLDWWFEKIHPDDKERVVQKFREHLDKGISNWQDEYRFQCADGSFKFLIDRGIILYEGSKPVRIIGAIEDITERKLLEEKLLQEGIQQQKQISLATLEAQERERNKISEELHDNVNQILMSAKLFMESALKNPEQAQEYIETAIGYQCFALEEIRKLSKSLNSSVIKTVGLKEGIEDILLAMHRLQHLETEFEFDSELENSLAPEQKLMLFRIVQEQTNNIIKYAGAARVQIRIKQNGQQLSMQIADDGRGFDAGQKRNGIGITNIMNRVNAYNGNLQLITAPGQGCRMEITFPLQNLCVRESAD